MHTNLLWNKVADLSSVSSDSETITLTSGVPKGIIKGCEIAAKVASGFKLKKGTLLTVSSSAAELTPHTGFAETYTWVLDGTVTPTATEDTVLTVAGVTLTFTGAMTVANLFAVLNGAKPGDTGATLAAKGTSVAGTGTLAGWYPLTDATNLTILWVSSTSGVNVSALTFTLVDTAGSPVDLSSHVTATNTAFSSSPVSAILATDVDTTSTAKTCPVFKELKAYADQVVLFSEPDTETETVYGLVPTMLATGLFSYEQLALRLLNTEFEIKQSLTSLA